MLMNPKYIGIAVHESNAMINTRTMEDLDTLLDFLDPFLCDGGIFVPCYQNDPYRWFI